jgi:methylmalonyl-CoA carboxyltransferase large subunit
MPTAIDFESLILELKEQVRALSERLARVEAAGAGNAAVSAEAAPVTAAPVPVEAPAPAPVAATAPAVPESITEEELMAIAAAVAAYMGVRAHIRQIRLVSSSRWAQEGRVSIQASHRLH